MVPGRGWVGLGDVVDERVGDYCRWWCVEVTVSRVVVLAIGTEVHKNNSYGED